MTIEPSARTFPSVEEVTRITQISDSVLRNLRITHAYHEISRATARITGGGANWCTFATWASKQAGQTIRREDLVRTFERLFRIAPDTDTGTLIQGVVIHLTGIARSENLPLLHEKLVRAINPALAFERASDAVARGNLKVFAELAPLFVRFLDECITSSSAGAEELARFCAALRPGDPPDGQHLLAQAFTAYHTAVKGTSSRPELIFFANLLIGFHEQTRLQPEIAEAMNATIGSHEEIRERLLEALQPALLFRLRRRVSRWFGRQSPLDAALDRFIDAAQLGIREIITRHLMTLRLAHGEVLRLGRDLPARAFSDSLKALTNRDLVGLLARIDPTPDSLTDSGARDWSDLADRMHFITDYFRCYHDEASLLEEPFSAAQLEDLQNGRVPPPPL